MSTSQYATEPALANSEPDFVQNPASNTSGLPKVLLIGFAGTVTFGLALATLYVGLRISSTNEVSQPAPNQAQLIAQPSPELPPAPPGLFLEVAGLGPQQDAEFAKDLEMKGYQTRIFTTTDTEPARIFIGPFLGRESLEDAKSTLQSAGVLAVESNN